MTPGPMSRTMLKALQALQDGQHISLSERPRGVWTRTMWALEKRGLVRWDGDQEYGEWVLTGKKWADYADVQAEARARKWAK